MGYDDEPVLDDRTDPGSASNRPGLEALRLAVHHPEAVVDRLDEVLFTDGVQRRAFAALAAADSLHQAVEGAPPDVAALLRRISVEEPVVAEKPLADPVDAVVFQLLRGAVRPHLADLQARPRGASDGSATRPGRPPRCTGG